jgi:hypothetical protein
MTMTPFGRHRETRFCHEKRLSKRISPRSGTPAQTRGARVFTPGLPLRVVRRFQTTHPTYKWLNRLQCLNIGEADLERFEVRYTCTLSGSLQGFPCQHTKPARTVSPEMAKRRWHVSARRADTPVSGVWCKASDGIGNAGPRRY